MGLKKNVMTCSHHYHIIQNISCAKNPLWCACLSPTSIAPDNHWSFYCLYNFYFSRMSYSWNHTICSLFRLALSLCNLHLRFLYVLSWLNNCFSFFLFFFFLVLNSIQLSGCTIIYWFFHLLKTSWFRPSFDSFE